MPIARNIIAAKIQASKRGLQRQIRNYGENAAIQSAVDSLNISLRQLKGAAELDVAAVLRKMRRRGISACLGSF